MRRAALSGWVGVTVWLGATGFAAPARAQAGDVPLGPFTEAFPVAGSTDPLAPPINDTGPATGGWLVDGQASPIALADGSFLFAQSGEPGIVDRVSADGWVRPAAGAQPRDCTGAGCGGPPGDGGPAVLATVRDPTGITAAPDGGFLIADKLSGVVRRVDAQGIITTVAGEPSDSEPDRPVGIGGPATEARLVEPSAVAAAPDGEIFILDGHRWILRVDQAGVLRSVADLRTSNPSEIALSPDGSLLVLDTRGIVRLAAQQPLVRLARFRFRAVGLLALADGGALTFDTWEQQVLRVTASGGLSIVLRRRPLQDFAGRDPARGQYAATGLGLSPQGLLLVTSSAVLLAPSAPAARLLVRIRDARTFAVPARLAVESTQSAQATVTVHPAICCGNRALASATVPVAPGISWLDVPAPPRHGLFRLQVQLRAGPAVAIDSVSLLLGASLPVSLIRGIWRQSVEDEAKIGCVRMSARRVDCWSHARDFGSHCQAYFAEPDGVIRHRRYRCAHPAHGTIRRPHWTSAPFLVRWTF